LQALGLSAAWGVLAACAPLAPAQSSGPSGAAAPTSGAAAKPAAAAAPTPAQPRTGGTLRVGVLGDIANLDPHQLTPPIPDVTFSIWDRVLAYGPNLQPLPQLAESFEMSADGRQLKLTIRQGVQFHTGRELTADDVKWTLMRLKTDPVVATTGFYTQIGPLSGVDTLDKYNLVVKSDDPWPGIYDLLVLMSVVDPVTMQGPNAKTQPVGTGPFTFGEWVQGDHLRLVKNKNYWNAGHPYVDEIMFQIYNDAQAMVTAVEAGALDVANKPPLVDAARFQQDSKFQVLVAQTGGTRYSWVFNVLAPPTDNQKFRQGMLYALDRQRIVDSVLKGFGVTGDLPFAASSPAYDATRDHHYTFDLDKAKSLIADSGVSDPTLDFNYSAVSPEWAGIAQVYQADLGKIGVKLNLKPVDPVTLNAEVRQHTYTGIWTGQVPLGQISPTQQAFNPNYSPVVSFSGFKSDKLVELNQSLQHEVDPTKQKQVYVDWSDYILDQAWATQIATQTPLAVTSQKTHDLKYTLVEMLDYRDVWLES
jgi:peptide/nickel transport system substrate-binding protein